MDLFGDLPPPSENNSNNRNGTYQNQASSLLQLGIKRPLHSETVTHNKIQKIKGDILHLKPFVAERQGERNEMQDTTSLFENCTSDYQYNQCGLIINRVSFFAVFDGHGGKNASQFAQENLHVNINKNFPKEAVLNFDSELKKSIIKAFKDTDEAFLLRASLENPPLKDGATAACVLVVNNTIYVANIGDSKTILVRTNEEGKSTILPLSKDHSPLNYEERQRIQNAGGFVKDGRVQGIVEVSRAFGDLRFKKYIISKPDIVKSTLTERDRYILIACDGLWKGITVAEAVDFIEKILMENEYNDDGFLKASNEVANEAIRRGSSDNITVVIIRIYS
ncbi:integrin-linked kinase-associated serine/threonine phosphatase 2C isoform X3 [Hydra vulgaris]|uniref:Integrin-linked kinase-associated serine/threonine phosphatase 2C isoform X3 n=1 Tax=Hydra vulgaris TaxID=6087 RepID=A0ABM4C321_HYDVU